MRAGVVRNPEQDEKDVLRLEAVANGDRDAFRTLFERYYPLIYRFVLRMVRDPGMAEEAANDALLDVWRGAGRFKGNSRVSTWVYGIAHHKALSALRRFGNRREVDLEEADCEADPSDSPEEAFSISQRSEHVRKALQGLPLIHRAVTELVFFHGLNYSEIAQVLGCPENTVKTRIFHAKRKLHVLLAGVGGT